MIRPISVLVLSALILGGCATVRESRFNPFNWFGRSTSQPVVATDEGVNPLIPRRRSIFQAREAAPYAGRPIGEISELLVERRPGGAVVRVTGVADRLGPWDVRIVAVDAETDEDTLTFDMRNLSQPGPSGGSDAARSVTAAIALTDQQLAGIREIRVKGARNIRTVRR